MVTVAALPVAAQDERPHGAPEATPNPVPLEAPAGDGTAVRLTTELGDVVIGLFNESAPVAAENFLNLANEGFYDGVGFHRAVPGFVLQGGDPDGTGMGGPDYRIQDEEVVGRYGRGVVAMARTQEPNSPGSQFFIILDDGAESALEAFRTYTIFGRVVEGMDVVDEIVAAREPSDQIPDPVRIIETSVEQVELPPEPTPAPPTAAELAADELVARVPDTVAGFEMQSQAFAFEQIDDQLDPEVVARLQAAAAEAGADLELFAVAQSAGSQGDDFLSIAAASVPGVPGEQLQPIMTELLLPGTSIDEEDVDTFGERTAQRTDLGGALAWIFSEGDVVWFVVTSLDDPSEVIAALS
jgi:peptidyl-prolyl cis-trans isomerase B (cyclophilin B)